MPGAGNSPGKLILSISKRLTRPLHVIIIAPLQARSSVWLERYLDTVEVSGSSPLAPTITPKAHSSAG